MRDGTTPTSARRVTGNIGLTHARGVTVRSVGFGVLPFDLPRTAHEAYTMVDATRERVRSAVSPASHRHLLRAQRIVSELFGPAEQRTFNVRYWDGSTECGPREARFTLVIRDPAGLRRALLPPSEISLASAYLTDLLDIEGDIVAASALSDWLETRLASPRRLLTILGLALALPATPAARIQATTAANLTGTKHGLERDKQAVSYHYDVSNDFYRLWLDPRMVYTCAYFRKPDLDLEAAQLAKLDLVCRKLRIAQGERFLDIGCGWGSLVMHAASRFGAQSVGITLSEEQAKYARERIQALGLSDRCRIEILDYRKVNELGPFDKVASVGMFEQVGRAKMRAYFDSAWQATKPGGLFLNHGIVALDPLPRVGSIRWLKDTFWGRRRFMEKYVFPDGELIELYQADQAAAAAGFEARDIESLREHYLLTLRHWVQRLESEHTRAVEIVGEWRYRVWRLYMAGCAQAFRAGQIGVVQMLLARPDHGAVPSLPMTREDLYGEPGPEAGFALPATA